MHMGGQMLHCDLGCAIELTYGLGASYYCGLVWKALGAFMGTPPELSDVEADTVGSLCPVEITACWVKKRLSCAKEQCPTCLSCCRGVFPPPMSEGYAG